MNAKVQADVKAIAARRADGQHIDQRSLRFEKQKERKIEQWRNQHVKPAKQGGAFDPQYGAIVFVAALISVVILVMLLTK